MNNFNIDYLLNKFFTVAIWLIIIMTCLTCDSIMKELEELKIKYNIINDEILKLKLKYDTLKIQTNPTDLGKISMKESTIKLIKSLNLSEDLMKRILQLTENLWSDEDEGCLEYIKTQPNQYCLGRNLFAIKEILIKINKKNNGYTIFYYNELSKLYQKEIKYDPLFNNCKGRMSNIEKNPEFENTNTSKQKEIKDIKDFHKAIWDRLETKYNQIYN